MTQNLSAHGFILVAGLTPAWQQILVLDRLQLGEVNRARESAACGSGKVVNVALALHHLGAPAHSVILAGGDAGRRMEQESSAFGIKADWVHSESPTRVCTTVIDRAKNKITELVENANPVTPEEVETFVQYYELAARGAAFVILTGSLPPGAPSSLYRRLLERTSCAAMLDARGPELIEALAARPLVVKPNRQELAATLARPLPTDDDLIRGMNEIIERGAQSVVVTEGSKAVWFARRGEVLRFQPPELNAVNPIGCGDCLAAGMAWGLLKGLDYSAAVRLGMAAAAENALALLPARLRPDEVNQRAVSIAVPVGLQFENTRSTKEPSR